MLLLPLKKALSLDRLSPHLGFGQPPLHKDKVNTEDDDNDDVFLSVTDDDADGW